MRHQTFIIILASILLASCEQKKKPLSFYGNEEVVEDTTEVVQSQAASRVSYDADSRRKFRTILDHVVTVCRVLPHNGKFVIIEFARFV